MRVVCLQVKIIKNMDKKKLNEAAVDAWVKYTPTVCLFNNIFTDAFKDGAQWLMQQPLADRLTDEEKEKIKGMYADLIPLKGHMAGIVGKMMLLEQIFGQELFNEK